MAEEPPGAEPFRRRAWADAYQQLQAADTAGPLAATDIDRFALAASLLGRDEDAARLRERAHRAFLDAGNSPAAARSAFWLALGYIQSGEMAQAGGWLGRATRILEESGIDCAEQGYVRIPEGLHLQDAGETELALSLFEAIEERGRRFHDPDLSTLGRLGRGTSMLRLGRLPDGTALLDEAMVAIVAGDVSPLVAGIVYCAVIEACREVFDFRRCQEWTEALSRWCEAQPDLVPFRGRCQVYRSEMMQLHGDWDLALDEAGAAERRLAGPPRHPEIGTAFYQQAELLRLRGAFTDAQEAYRRAEESGRNPEPGRALLRLAQGRRDASVTAIRHALNETPDGPARTPLLPAAVQIFVSVSATAEAEEVAAQLASTAAGLGSEWLLAEAERALGTVALALHDATGAIGHLRTALDAWQLLNHPYETARTRALLAAAARATGDPETAETQLRAAKESFSKLGATPDLRRLEEADDSVGATDRLTPREIEVLRLVATGMTNRAIAANLTISEKTVAHHVANILGKLALSSRAAATAYAYEHGLN